MRLAKRGHQADATPLATDHGQQAWLGLVDMRQMVRRHRHPAEPALFDGDAGQHRIEPQHRPLRCSQSPGLFGSPCGRGRRAPAGRRRSCDNRRGCGGSPTPPARSGKIRIARSGGSGAVAIWKECSGTNDLGQAWEQTVRYRRWWLPRRISPAIRRRFPSKYASPRASSQAHHLLVFGDLAPASAAIRAVPTCRRADR